MVAAEAMQPVVAAASQVVREVLFVAGVAAWWLLCVQWNVIDRILGGPNLNEGHMATAHERRLEAEGMKAVLGYTASKTERGQQESAERATAAMAARHDLQGGTQKDAIGEAAEHLPPCDEVPDAGPAASAAVDALAAEKSGKAAENGGLRRMRDSLSRLGSHPSDASIETFKNPRSVYSALKRKMQVPKERLNVKQRVSDRVQRYRMELFPDLCQSIGVEAAAGTLATALPSGIRDAGVRFADRLEAMLRRWAIFFGGVAVLARLLLWR